MLGKWNLASADRSSVEKPRVLVCDSIAKAGLDVLSSQTDLDVRTGLSEQELISIVASYDGLIVRSQTRITSSVIEAASKLQVIGRAGIGVDNIDLDAATRLGVLVVNSPLAVNVAAAEHALAMIFALSRHIPAASRSLSEGKWQRSTFVGTEIRGKTLGLVGLGNIGSELAKRAAGLEMRVLASDPYVSAEYAERLGVTLTTFESLLAEADFISIHVPLTARTRGMIGLRELHLMKRGARLINCARGGIVDEDALLKALDEGHLDGAALDVFASEPPTGSPLVTHPSVVATPHLGASTEEAQVNAALEVAEQVVAVLRGQQARYSVNLPGVRPEALSAIQPYVRLGEMLGNLLAQLGAEPGSRLEIHYAGDAAELDTGLVKAATLNGFLSVASPEHVNLVNAAVVARARGLTVVEQKTDDPAESFANLISVRVDGAAGLANRVDGTVINQVPHLTRVDDYRVDVVPSGQFMLFCHHTDQPGVVGRIGTLLGSYDINISFMQLGRQEPRGEAMMVLGLDEAVTEDSELFRRILEEGSISQAKLVRP